MFVTWPTLDRPRPGILPDRDGRGQFPERLHLPDPLAEERDLAELALPALLVGDRAAGQYPDRELARPAGRMPRLRRADRVRYPLVEALVGLLFLGAFLVDVVAAPRGRGG